MIAWWLGWAAAWGGAVPQVDEGHAFHPVWSDDGARLAFEINRLGGDVGLYVVPVRGEQPGVPVRVEMPRSGGGFASSARVAANPVWHPTQGLVFEGTDPGGRMRLYRWSGNGRAAEIIAPDQLPGDLSFPARAPKNGLVFVGGSTGAGDVRLQATPAAAPQRLTSTPASEAFPTFSPDGTRVTYTRKVEGAEDVFELRVAAGRERVTASGPGDQTRPTYAAEGTVVYFDGSRGSWDIVAVRDGRTRRLAKQVQLPLRARPALSPDGKWVAFAPADPAARSIELAKIDGSATVRIDTGFTACGEPSLVSQAGRWMLAFTALPSEQATWRFLHVMDVTDRVR